jgi:POT family proton-dependent oligopeptide transporter
MMGAWFGFNAIANYVAGLVGSHVGELGAMAIFSGIAISATISGVILLLCANKLVTWMHGVEGNPVKTESEETSAQTSLA